MFSVWEIGNVCSLLVRTLLSFFLFQLVVFQKVSVTAVVVVRLSLRAVSHSTCCAFYVINSKFVTSSIFYETLNWANSNRAETGIHPCIQDSFRRRNHCLQESIILLFLTVKQKKHKRLPSFPKQHNHLNTFTCKPFPFFQTSFEFNAEPLEWKDLSYRLW